MTLSPRAIIGSAAAIIAGIGVNIVLSLALDSAFQALGVLPPPGQAVSDLLHLLPFSYRAGIAILGFYVAARLAPSRPLLHALALASIAFLLTVANTIASWRVHGAAEPQWFQLAILALLFPMAWLGSRIVGHRARAIPLLASPQFAVKL